MRTLLLASSLLLVTACAEDVGKGKTAATVEDVPTEAAPAAAAGKALRVDPARSKVVATGAKVTAQHPIAFKDYEATVTVDGDTVTAVAFDVTMATLEADHPRLTSHLKNEDFFDVDNYPTSTFRSVSVTPGAEGGTHTVSGDLTIRGTTKRVSFPATIEVADAAVTASAEFVVNRLDFKVEYPGMKDDLIQDNVALAIAFTAPRG